MTHSESEFEELRARVSRLEAEVKALAEAHPTQAVERRPEPSEPPLLSPAATVVPPDAKPAREIPSTIWIAGAGAVIFLIGAVYGLTVSIQRGWISPPVRVGAGLVVGFALGLAAVRQLLQDRRGLGVALLATGAGTWTFALYFGSHEAALFAPVAGLLGTATATLAAGWVAARTRSDGAMAVALATGLVAPLAFSDGRGSVPGLLTWLLALSGSQVLTHYLAGTGARWPWSRLLGSAGVWLVVCLGVGHGRLESAEMILGMLAVMAVSVLAMVWLPAHQEPSVWPGAATVISQCGLALAAWLVWERSGYQNENFAVVLGVLAIASAGLVPLARRRMDSFGHDLPLWLLALGFGLLAVAVACDWRWVVLAWGTFAALLAWAARAGQQNNRPEAETLQVLTVIAATAASTVWLVLTLSQSRTELLFLNRVFCGGLLAALAWGLLAGTPGRLRPLAVVALQIVLVNAVAWEWARAIPTLHSENTSLNIGPLLATLTYALVGAGLWLRGLKAGEARARKLLRVTGYGWLVVASIKLLLSDLARADLLFRAVAALGVGAIFIAAAWWAGQRRAE